MPKITLQPQQKQIPISSLGSGIVKTLRSRRILFTRCSRCLDVRYTLWQIQMERFLEEELPA